MHRALSLVGLIGLLGLVACAQQLAHGPAVIPTDSARPTAIVAGTPAAAGVSYAVFFTPGSAALGAEGGRAVAAAAQAASAHPAAPILVTGFAAKNAPPAHTDAALLSRARAQAVVDQLVRDGVNETRIRGISVGGINYALDPVEAGRVTISLGAI